MTPVEYKKFSSSLQNMLAKIGRENGHGPFPSQDPFDEKLHHYYVDKTAKSFFDKRAEASLEALLKMFDTDLQKRVLDEIVTTKRLSTGRQIALVTAQHYVLNFSTRKGASRFKKELLTAALTKRGMKLETIQAVIEECTVDDEPSRSYTAVHSVE